MTDLLKIRMQLRNAGGPENAPEQQKDAMVAVGAKAHRILIRSPRGSQQRHVSDGQVTVSEQQVSCVRVVQRRSNFLVELLTTSL